MDENHPSIYKPIKNGQVCLVKFGHDGNRTSAVLEAFPLEGPIPHYYTLSYAWGLQNHVTGTIDSRLLHIGKERLRFITALHSFFQVLASKVADGEGLQDTWWWIDSICINMEDMEERSRQVQLMGEIYRHAQKVIIWLGETSDDTDRAIDFMHQLSDTVVRQLEQLQIASPSTEATPAEDLPRKFAQNEYPQDQYQQDWDALTNFWQRDGGHESGPYRSTRSLKMLRSGAEGEQSAASLWRVLSCTPTSACQLLSRKGIWGFVAGGTEDAYISGYRCCDSHMKPESA